VPVWAQVRLLIDRDSREPTVHGEPVGGGYQERHAVAFGKRVGLPEPVGIGLAAREPPAPGPVLPGC
jgi:hypothetical protein